MVTFVLFNLLAAIARISRGRIIDSRAVSM